MKNIARILRLLNIAGHFTPIEIKTACWSIADCPEVEVAALRAEDADRRGLSGGQTP
jgi:hypothetical protein